MACLYSDEHNPDHPDDLRFHVLDRSNGNGVWEDLTESEMVFRMLSTGMGLSVSSQFHHWEDDR
jgi:hypothetical protein